MPKYHRISWRPAAREDLAEIIDRINEDSPQSAGKVLDAIEGAVQRLSHFPKLAAESERMPGTREIPVFGSFLVFYRVKDDTIDVIGVAHSRRQYPIKRWAYRL